MHDQWEFASFSLPTFSLQTVNGFRLNSVLAEVYANVTDLL